MTVKSYKIPWNFMYSYSQLIKPMDFPPPPKHPMDALKRIYLSSYHASWQQLQLPNCELLREPQRMFAGRPKPHHSRYGFFLECRMTVMDMAF